MASGGQHGLAQSVFQVGGNAGSALGPLLAHDRDNNADLVGTLGAFFAANGSPKEAAERLQVHRNTVLYRLDRVRDITGYDLEDANLRLRLHLALHVHLALGPGDEERT